MPAIAPISPPDIALSQLDETEVSWQSIFWALVPLALNTMVQPTGQTLGLPKRYALMLRSSPIVCVVDCALVLIILIHFIWQGSSVSTAVRQLTVSRFQGSTGAITRDNSLSGLLENPWLRLFLFVGGTLPQTIKLYGLHGVPWTKAVASMYLIPTLIFELIAFIDRRNQDQGLPQDGVPQNGLPQDGLSAQPSTRHDVLISVARISGCLAIAMQVSLWVILWYMLYAESYELSQQDSRSILSFFIFLLMLMSYILDIYFEDLTEALLFFRIDDMPAVRSIAFCTRIILSLASKIAICIFFYIFYLANSYVQARCAYIIRPIHMVYIPTAFSFLLVYSISTRCGLGRLSQSLFCQWLAWQFLVWNVVFAYVYYIWAWDPHGTVAPGWTTYLG